MRFLGANGTAGRTAALMILLTAAACSSGTSPEEKPTEARVEVTGTSPVPLRLVTSVDFHETVVDGQVVQSLISSDTSFITLPYQETLMLEALGSVYVDVANLEEEAATVTLSVDLDSGQDFCPGVERTLAAGSGIDALRCVFVFLQRRL